MPHYEVKGYNLGNDLQNNYHVKAWSRKSDFKRTTMTPSLVSETLPSKKWNTSLKRHIGVT